MTNKINGIDVCEYFIDVVDEGEGTIDYKILPNSERLLVERIFEQNQQLKRLQKENEKLKKMLSKEPKAMQAFQIAYSGLKKDNEILWGMVKDYKTALEEIREIAFRGADGNDCTFCNSIFKKINKVLNDRD